VVVAVVVTNGWQDWHCGEVHLNCGDRCLNRCERKVPLRVWLGGISGINAVFDKIPWQEYSVVLLARVFSLLQHRDEKDLSGFITKNRHDVRIGLNVEMDVIEH
jgi:hypothetical protein